MKRRSWFHVHSWLGVMSGLLLFVICWSGTVAVLAHEIDWLLEPSMRPGHARPVTDWTRLQVAVESAHPDALRYALHAPLQAGFAAHAVVDTPAQSMLRVYLDPASGQVLGRTSYFNVQRFFRSLHMSLFDFGTARMWGYWFVGAFSLLLLASLVAPLVFYRRWWRGFFTLKRDHGARAFWSDLHKLAGVWSLGFGLLIALTGAWYLVEFFDPDLGYPTPPTLASSTGTDLPVGTLAAAATAQWPALRIGSITPRRGSYWGDVVHVDGQAEGWLVRGRANYLLLDAASGAVLHRQSAADLPLTARWVDTADPLHFGTFAGLWSKALWFGFGLLLSSLCLTGAYLHVQRLRHAGSRVGWRGTSAAAAVTAAVLAVAAWGGWRELAGYAAVQPGAATAPAISQPVALFVLAWTAATLVLLVAWVVYVTRASATTRKMPAPD